jgi:hypothetical protein
MTSLTDYPGGMKPCGALRTQKRSGRFIVSITDSGSSVPRVACQDAHFLKVGSVITIADNSEATNNMAHTVTAVVSPTVFDTDIDFIGAGTGGRWTAN